MEEFIKKFKEKFDTRLEDVVNEAYKKHKTKTPENIEDHIHFLEIHMEDISSIDIVETPFAYRISFNMIKTSDNTEKEKPYYE